MKSLSKNEVCQISGGVSSINPCYKYIDCSYVGGTLADGSSDRCPQDGTKPGDAYKQLDTSKDRELTEYTFLLNICNKNKSTG